MRKALGAGFFLVLVLALTIPAGADLVNFDSITTTTYAVIPTGYAGFTWDTNFYVVANT
jgi:hypothetical protein